MADIKITPEEARAELSRRESDSGFSPEEARAELMRREATNQPTLQESFQGIFGDTKAGQITERTVVDGVMAPLTELGRGLVNASAGFYETLDAATDLVSSVTGTTKGGYFNYAGKTLRRYAEEELPRTNMHAIPKTFYELMGGAVPVLTEFALGDKVLKLTGASHALTKAGLSALNEPAKFALLGALDEYEKSGEYKSLLEGASKGLSFGMTFGIATKAFELTAKFGKNVGKKWIEFTTNNKKLAEDFIDNPTKYNKDLSGKVVNSHDVAKEHDIRKRDLHEKFAREKTLLSDNTRRQKEFLRGEFDEKSQDVKCAFANSKESLKEGSKIRLEDSMRESSEAIAKHTQIAEKGLVGVYDDAFKKYKVVRREAGENVQLAIETALKKDPLVSIPYDKGSKGFFDVVKKKCPFRIEKKAIMPRGDASAIEQAIKQGAYTPRTVDVVRCRTAADVGNDAKIFDGILKEFKGKSASGELSIRYLQDLKGGLNNLSQKAFSAGNNELGIFYRDLSKSVNPANIVSGSKTLSKSLKGIAKANKEFAKVVPKYEEAIKQYYKKDAQGNYVPDINKAVGAVQRGDTVAIRQMKKADSALPEKDRILPKVNSLVGEMNKKAAQEKGILSNLKRKAIQDSNKLVKAEKQALSNIRTEKTRMTREQRGALEDRTRSVVRLKQHELNETIDQLDKSLTYYRNIEALNSAMAQGKLASWMQRAAFWGTVGSSVTGGLEKAMGGSGGVTAGQVAGSGIAFAGASPRVASRLGSVVAGNTQLQRAVQNETNMILKSLEFEGGAVSEVVGRRIQKALEK